MVKRHFFAVSVAAIIAGLAGVLVVLWMRSSIPSYPEVYDWPREVDGVKRSLAQQREELVALAEQVEASHAPRLAGVDKGELARAIQAMPPASDPTAGRTQETITRDFELERAISDFSSRVRETIDRARSKGRLATILFATLALCGGFGLLRLRKRGMALVGNGIAILVSIYGILMLVLGGGSLVMLSVTLLLVGCLALAMLAAALPDAVVSPLVAAAEAELRALPPERRWPHIAGRVLAGAALIGVAAAMSFAGMFLASAIGGGGAVIAVGAVSVGTQRVALPLVAFLRLRYSDLRDLPRAVARPRPD